MARDKKLNVLIAKVRDGLKTAERGIVDASLQEWEQIADGDFEIFLDVLEGVITTPLKRIYKAKLRRNDDWWHKNFSHKPVAFFELFGKEFHHRKSIVSWVLLQLQSYEAVSDTFVDNSEIYLEGIGKPVERKPIVDPKKYYVYARNLGDRPTSLEEMDQYLVRNKGRFDQSKLERFQMMDASGNLVSPRIIRINIYTLLGSFRYWDPDKDEGYGETDEYTYGREYIEMQGGFPFLNRIIYHPSTYLPQPGIPEGIQETEGQYLIMVSDPTVQIDTDLIVKEGVGVGLKIDAIEHTLTQSAICISFSDKGHNYAKRWLFPHSEGVYTAVDILKETTLVDDWQKMVALLPNLDKQDQKSALYFFLEHLPEDKQIEALTLLEDTATM